MFSLGQKIRELREAKQISGPELAKQIGISKATLSFYENNKREPTFSTIKKLSRSLEVSAAYLFDQVPELVEKEPAMVAASEAFRIFAEEHPSTTYAELVDLPEAPKTVVGWKAFHKLHRRASRQTD